MTPQKENYSPDPKKIPVILVHGWKSHPGIWNNLISKLNRHSIPSYSFSHSEMTNAGPQEIALALRDYLRTLRSTTDYSGPVDIVTHSMGGMATRYLLEIIDKEEREIQVRQLILIAAPNNGSAMAEIFNHPEHGPKIRRTLAGVFVPHRYDPARDRCVQGIRTQGGEIAEMKMAGLREDIIYRNILAENITQKPEFFPHFQGKTWSYTPELGWQQTFAGDGIIPHTDSFLSGTGVDIIPRDAASLNTDPVRYCHIHLPTNPEVIDRVMEYLRDPATTPDMICP